MRDQELMAMLAGVIEKNTGAMERIASAIGDIKKAVEKDAEASEKMADQVRGLRATIQGAQRKIGEQLGPEIERVKQTHAALESERREVLDAQARGASEGRSRPT